MDQRIDDVIKFWFDDTTPEQWFKKDADFDATIRDRFGALHEEARSGALHWHGSTRGQLALLVLLDQFPRNMFRNDPRAFATDAAALAISKELLGSVRAAELTMKQRLVTLLPFEHSEALADQDTSVASYDALAEQAHGEDKKTIGWARSYAIQHRELIQRFGRFPHRNAVLGRASTPDEVAYLATPGAGF